MVYFWISAVVIAAFAAGFDWKTGHIPNWLTFGALAAAIGAHAIHGGVIAGGHAAMSEAAKAFGGAIVCGLLPAVLFFKGGIGGGDVKLFAAIGALCAAPTEALPVGGLEAETYTFVVAAILAPARLAYDGTLLRTLRNTFALAANPFRAREKRREVPTELMTWFRLGPCIFLGTAGALIFNWSRL